MLYSLYALLFLQALAFGWMLTWAAIRVAPRLGYLDQPGTRKIHAEPKPLLGGAAIYLAFLGVLALDLLLIAKLIPADSPLLGAFPIPVQRNIGFTYDKLAAIFAGSLMMFVMGLIDDRRPIHPGIKLLVQIGAVFPLLWTGVMIRSFLPLPVGVAATLIWVVFLTNAFNYLDNMDGLCAGVAAICLLVFATVAAQGAQWFVTAIFVALAGALCGFLRYNWTPSKIFMGDAGSLTVGYLIAALSILATYYAQGMPTGLPILMPAIILGVPIFDSLSVYAIRVKQGRKLWVGDTSHFSHRMVALGMSRRQAVLFIYIVTLMVGLGALPLRHLERPAALLHGIHIGLIFVIIGALEFVAARRKRGEDA